jgi:UDP-glucose 4-epimerase
MKILVTGGSGYIGSHTLIQLIESGYTPVVIDNLTNSSEESLARVKKITGRAVEFIQADIRDLDALNSIFSAHQFQAVIHFAGLKAVGESVEQPIKYYENNVFGSLQLFKAMSAHKVKTIVFSSSATVYGDPISLPLNESMPTGQPTNPYGMSKLMIENILNDLYVSDNTWRIVNLRYFNPVGAHQSGLMGEDPSGIPNNLMPFITQTATGKREKLSVFGGDYHTHDGTGVRDYIHVVDLANGHIKALQKTEQEPGLWTVNLGTGVGYSVLDMIKAFEQASGQNIPYEIVARRSGDVASCYADPSYAKQVLGWEAQLGLTEMCEDAWRWQSMHPNGYR